MIKVRQEHIIYRYKKHKTKKIKSKNIYTSPIPHFIFLAILFFLIIFSGIYPFHSDNIETSAELSEITTLQPLNSIIYNNKKSTTKLPLFANILSTMSASLSPRPKIKHDSLHIPVAQAQANTSDDYCLNVPVLLYHHIQPLSLARELGHAQFTVGDNYFDMQMSYLAENNYHAISADELAYALIHHTSLPPKSIVITIDDAYDDNYKYAYQILKKYYLAGNFMIPTGLIENKGYMTWVELKEMSENPLITIYNHTLSHAYLGGETREKIEFEITSANNQLESNLGKSSNIFTYPYGSYSPLAIDVLKKLGFVAAFSTLDGTIQCESYIFALKRLHIGNAPLNSYGL